MPAQKGKKQNIHQIQRDIFEKDFFLNMDKLFRSGQHGHSYKLVWKVIIASLQYLLLLHDTDAHLRQALFDVFKIYLCNIIASHRMSENIGPDFKQKLTLFVNHLTSNMSREKLPTHLDLDSFIVRFYTDVISTTFINQQVLISISITLKETLAQIFNMKVGRSTGIKQIIDRQFIDKFNLFTKLQSSIETNSEKTVEKLINELEAQEQTHGYVWLISSQRRFLTLGFIAYFLMMHCLSMPLPILNHVTSAEECVSIILILFISLFVSSLPTPYNLFEQNNHRYIPSRYLNKVYNILNLDNIDKLSIKQSNSVLPHTNKKKSESNSMHPKHSGIDSLRYDSSPSAPLKRLSPQKEQNKRIIVDSKTDKLIIIWHLENNQQEVYDSDQYHPYIFQLLPSSNYPIAKHTFIYWDLGSLSGIVKDQNILKSFNEIALRRRLVRKRDQQGYLFENTRLLLKQLHSGCSHYRLWFDRKIVSQDDRFILYYPTHLSNDK
jgi:hypothetical protein